jgi:hypothetical protein
MLKTLGSQKSLRDRESGGAEDKVKDQVKDKVRDKVIDKVTRKADALFQRAGV